MVSPEISTREEVKGNPKWSLRHKIRYLYLLKATATDEEFRERSRKIFDELKTYNSPLPHQNIRGVVEEIEQDLLSSASEYVEPDLPRSAGEFVVESHGRKRKIPPFTEVARREFVTRFPLYRFLENESIVLEPGNGVPEFAKKLAELDVNYLERAFYIYEDIDRRLVPFFEEAVEAIRALPDLESRRLFGIRKKEKRVEVYHGRDAEFLYRARRADVFSIPRQMRPKVTYLVTSRPLLETDDFDEYLAQHKITFNSLHFDVGLYGSTLRGILDILAKEEGISPSQEELSKRIKLMRSTIHEEYQLKMSNPPRVERVKALEEEMDEYTSTPKEFDRVKGKLIPRVEYLTPRILDVVPDFTHWVRNQAITRAYLFKASYAPHR